MVTFVEDVEKFFKKVKLKKDKKHVYSKN